MITVHHLNRSRSHRVLWLLEELGVPYQLKTYQRDPKTMLAPPELKRVHPLGKSPVVVDGDEVLAESGAIIETLLERYDSKGLAVHQGPNRVRYLYWMHFAEGSAMPPLLLHLIFAKLRTEAPIFIRPLTAAIAKQIHQLLIDPNISAQLDYMEQTLSQSHWFAGPEFSGADIQMSFPVEAAASRVSLKGRPKLGEFIDRIRSRPAYQRAIEKGGPLNFDDDRFK